MNFLFLLFTTLSFAAEVLPLAEAEKICKDQTRWGYFRQISFKGSDQVNLWADKDLYGKFKTESECESDRKKYKKGWSGPCESFGSIKEDVFTIFIAAKYRDSRQNEDLLIFREKESCEKALKSGGSFKIDSRNIYVGGSEKPEPSLGYRNTFNFFGSCYEMKVIACAPGDHRSVFNDLN